MSMSMESQLEEYRARRRRQALIDATKRKIISMVSLNINQGDTEPVSIQKIQFKYSPFQYIFIKRILNLRNDPTVDA